mmetsp:Transcript_79125/g.214054  ORF Transcript_79125/g.214054 Transcript_79125/m.214054 type:complete len:274 (+) Transcript_79125:137-958(+)
MAASMELMVKNTFLSFTEGKVSLARSRSEPTLRNDVSFLHPLPWTLTPEPVMPSDVKSFNTPNLDTESFGGEDTSSTVAEPWSTPCVSEISEPPCRSHHALSDYKAMPSDVKSINTRNLDTESFGGEYTSSTLAEFWSSPCLSEMSEPPLRSHHALSDSKDTTTTKSDSVSAHSDDGCFPWSSPRRSQRYVHTKNGCLNGSSCEYCHESHRYRSQRPSKATRIRCKEIAAKALEAVQQSGKAKDRKALHELAHQSAYMRSLLRGVLAEPIAIA